MRLLVPLLFLLAVSVAVGEDKKETPVVKPRDGKSETIKLFDGETLKGWEGYEDLWSVKDGIIVAKNTGGSWTQFGLNAGFAHNRILPETRGPGNDLRRRSKVGCCRRNAKAA